MADESKTITIKFRGDATQLNDTTDNIDKMIKVLQNDTKALQKQMKFGDDYSTQMSLYGDALDNVSEAIRLAKINQSEWNKEIENYKSKGSLTDKELNSLLTAQRKYAENTKQIENLTEQYSRLAKEMVNYKKISITKELDAERRKFDNIGRSIGRVADAFKYLSLAAGAALTGSASAAITFETAMANVNKVLRSEEKDYFGALQQQILDMSKELPLAASEIAQVTANALQLGISAKDVGVFTETILKLGTATNIASEEAAIAIAQLFNITGEQFSNIESFGAALTSLGNQFPTFESDIMEMASKIAAAGSSVGMTTQDILGLATALSSMGLKADAGGSSISTILRNIDTEVATSGKKLNAWAEQAGMSVEQFKNAWTSDVTGTFQTLVNSIAETVREGGNLNVIMDSLGISAIRQKDTFSRLIQANDTLNDALQESVAAWKAVEDGAEGALNDEFAVRVQTLASQFQLLKNDLYVLGVTIGEQLIPYLKIAVNYAKSLVEWFTQLSPTAKQWITGLLVSMAALYPALKAISGVFLGWSSLIKGISGLIKSTIKPWKAWLNDSAMIKFTNGLTVMWTKIKAIGTAIQTYMGNLFTGKVVSLEMSGDFGIAEALGTPLRIVATLKAAILALAAAFAVLYATNENFKRQINEIAADVFDRLRTKLESVWETLKKVGGWLSTEFNDLITTIVELWKKYLEPALSYLLVALTKLAGDILVDLTGILGGLVKILAVSLANILEFIIDAVRALLTLLAPLISFVATLFGKLVELVTWGADKLRPAVTWLLNGLEQIGELLVGFLIVAFDALARVIEWAGTKLGEFYEWLNNTGALKSFTDAIKTIRSVFETIVNRVGKALEKLRDLIGLFNSTPTLGEMVGSGRYGGVSTIGDITVRQTNNFNGSSVEQTSAAATNMLDMIDNALGKRVKQW